MNEYEYDLLQKQLTSKLEKAPYDCPNSKYKEGYKQGLLAAKSIVSQFYKNHSIMEIVKRVMEENK